MVRRRRGATRVEVSTDGGRSWKDAQLHDPVARKAHARFSLPWNWDGEETILQSRCTDDQGVVQPSLPELAKLRGQDLSYFRTPTTSVGDFNAIQPWKVNHDGSVQNAVALKLLRRCNRSAGCQRGAGANAFVFQYWPSADPRRNSCVGYIHWSRRQRPSGRSGYGKGRRNDLCGEVRRLSWAGRRRRQDWPSADQHPS